MNLCQLFLYRIAYLHRPFAQLFFEYYLKADEFIGIKSSVKRYLAARYRACAIYEPDALVIFVYDEAQIFDPVAEDIPDSDGNGIGIPLL